MQPAPDVWVEYDHIAALRAGRPFGDVAASFLNLYEPIIRRACQLNQRATGASAYDFARRQEDAWVSALAAAAFPAALVKDVWPADMRGRLIVGFHFPRWPEVAVALMAREVSILTPRPLPWLTADARAIPFRECPAGAARVLRHRFRSGEGVAIMGDHVYPGTRTVPVTLIGREAQMPLGLLSWAKRFAYAVDVVDADENGVRLVRVEPDEHAVASELNAQIRKTSAEWLQWCSADRLVTGLVD